MISLYSGTNGSGKSLHMAIDIYSRVRYGHMTIANFQINLDSIKNAKKDCFLEIDNSELTPKNLVQISREFFSKHKFREGAIRLYIDEAQLLFNARDWGRKGRDNWLKFFSQHRKFGYDIVFVAQFDRMIDRQIRSLVEYEIIHRKVSNFGKFGKVFNFVSGGGLFVGVKMWYPLKQKVGVEYIRFRKKYNNLYDTNKFFDDALFE